MMRTQFVKLTGAPLRTFATTSLRASEGATGGVRSGGAAASDAFNKREQASEGKWIREKEMESLRKLKEQIAASRQHLDALDQHLEELNKERGGK